MITKCGQIYLYQKQANNLCIKVTLLKNMKINTYWYIENRDNWYKENKQILHKLKVNGCAICGYNKCDRALSFHHSNPKNKKFSISSCNMVKKNLAQELNKCVLLCANCHMEIEEEEKKNA